MRLPQRPPPLRSLLQQLSPDELVQAGSHAPYTTDDGRYLHWNDLRYRTPRAGETVESWWAKTRLRRLMSQTDIERMRAAFGMPFSYCDFPALRERLYRFDRMNVARELATALGNAEPLDEYRVRQLIEEAISSSLIEGARPTTRDVAREMVREQREPASLDERMILNNWNAMARVRELAADSAPLQLAHLLELHRIIGEDVLEVPAAEGALRTSADQVSVADNDGEIWHLPPQADGIEDRLQQLLDFINNAASAAHATFLHPVLRSIIAHFWLAYEHPFRDGNGRVARALYYFCMLRNGYDVAEFLSISGPIERSPKGYYLAFAHTESDDFDLTYFILHQLQTMEEAMTDLLQHLRRRAKRTKALDRRVANFASLNHRQRALLSHVTRRPTASVTIESHQRSHGVHYQTARTDLLDLVERDLLIDTGGKPKRFTLAPSLAKIKT